MNEPEQPKEKKSKEKKPKSARKFSIFSIFAILAALALFVAFFLPLLQMKVETEKFADYKSKFDARYARLQEKLDVMKTMPAFENASAYEEATVDVREFSQFFDDYGFLLPKVERLKVKDIQRFKEIADALFNVIQEGSLKSLYDFSKALEQNKDLISNVQNAEEFIKNFTVMAQTLKWVSIGIPLVGFLLLFFVVFSSFGKFNAFFLILTFIPGLAFVIMGAVSIWVLPNMSEVFTNLNLEEYVMIPEQIKNFIAGLSAGLGIYFMFAAGCLMAVISIFGVNTDNYAKVYVFYLICGLFLGIVLLNYTNVI